jgi:alpha/beta superfamily hydrolase
MINNFKMPTNKTAADALISQMRKQRTDLENKLTNLQKDNLKVKEKVEKLKAQLSQKPEGYFGNETTHFGSSDQGSSSSSSSSQTL